MDTFTLNCRLDVTVSVGFVIVVLIVTLFYFIQRSQVGVGMETLGVKGHSLSHFIILY